MPSATGIRKLLVTSARADEHHRAAAGPAGAAAIEVEERALPSYDRIFRVIEGGAGAQE
ncbi:hypothetical protein ACFQ6N_17165 [Kitasatospora sp. NPDC056446]|uniref:hypothetical protein n=1 Tax=Kitasatospora sp. NPDC056446 TaxID=3345819 RepID=UPI0036C0D72F